VSEIQPIYEKLWCEAVSAFDNNNPRLDPFLKKRSGDKRRGITLLVRPDFQVRKRIEKFLREAAKITPEQYFYQPEEFHLTVLSAIPGSETWRQQFKKLPDYLAALDEALKSHPAFSVNFHGVTASPEAVMIQGFPANDMLAKLRDELRAALIQRGLGGNLDRRYKITAAHLTVVRFSTPMRDWNPLKELLSTNRNTDFGTTRFRSLELIESDWYASTDSVRTLREYPLS
jgi:2'-5' RNA ligase